MFVVLMLAMLFCFQHTTMPQSQIKQAVMSNTHRMVNRIPTSCTQCQQCRKGNYQPDRQLQCHKEVYANLCNATKAT